MMLSRPILVPQNKHECAHVSNMHATRRGVNINMSTLMIWVLPRRRLATIGARAFLSAATRERWTILVVARAVPRSDAAADRNVRAPALGFGFALGALASGAIKSTARALDDSFDCRAGYHLSAGRTCTRMGI